MPGHVRRGSPRQRRRDRRSFPPRRPRGCRRTCSRSGSRRTARDRARVACLRCRRACARAARRGSRPPGRRRPRARVVTSRARWPCRPRSRTSGECAPARIHVARSVRSAPACIRTCRTRNRRRASRWLRSRARRQLADDQQIDAVAARRPKIRVDVELAAQTDQALFGSHGRAVELGERRPRPGELRLRPGTPPASRRATGHRARGWHGLRTETLRP